MRTDFAVGLKAAVLAFVAALACGPADASPRAAAQMGGALIPDAEMDVWLRRLAGRYKVEGMIEVIALEGCLLKEAEDGGAPLPPEYCNPIKGMADCIAIGDGPGVQCVLNLAWVDMYRVVLPPNPKAGVYNIPGGVSYLDPAMTLFGLDPGNAALSHLLVDHKGLPEGGPGYIKGNRGTFETECVNAPALFQEMDLKGTATCHRISRIDANPDADVLHWSIDIELEVSGNRGTYTRLEMTLRREHHDGGEEMSGAKR